MLWFSSKISLEELLSGKTDFHSHLLPGVDDGADTVDTALYLLSSMRDAGLKAVCCTPHVWAGHTVDRSNLIKDKFKELSQKVGGLKLFLGAEYMLDEEFNDHLQHLPLSVDGKHLLIEMSFLAPSNQLDESIYDIQLAGYIPVLAHPERYPYMTIKELQRLNERGVKFQLNLGSIGGYYGRESQEQALDILENGWYHLVGTDLHHKRGWNAFSKMKVRESLADTLQLLFDNNEKVLCI